MRIIAYVAAACVSLLAGGGGGGVLAAECEAVRVLLQLGATIDAMDTYGNTALHIVASTGDVQAMHTLLSADAPVDAVNEAGLNALHSAAEFGHAEAVCGRCCVAVQRWPPKLSEATRQHSWLRITGMAHPSVRFYRTECWLRLSAQRL